MSRRSIIYVDHDRTERIVPVNGDADLAPAVDSVRKESSMPQAPVYVSSRNPTRGAAVELRSGAGKNKAFPRQLLPRWRFPRGVQDGRGSAIKKPASR